MRELDFASLYRSAIGFDRMMDLLQSTTADLGDNYPPYNIEKSGEDSYRITMAVAGFTQQEISIIAQHNLLLVAGVKQSEDEGVYLHRGIAARGFERRFELADFVKVSAASLDNGLLSIDLTREVPEAMKPRRIDIQIGDKPVESGDKTGRKSIGQAA
jgi:molecular chaperone IbpA